MTVVKLTVSLDPAVAARAKQDVAAGKAASVSSWLNEAGRARAEQEELGTVLAELLEAAGGPPTTAELTEAEARLAAADRP